MAVLLEVREAHKRFGDRELLAGANASITDDYKIGLIGRNGAGKSTLCRLILGEEHLDSGEIIHHPNLRLGYLRQHDPFEPGESVLDFLMRDSEQSEWRCGEVAGDFEIKGSRLTGPVAELSGGWQTRVKLAALLLHDPNLLLLDEPTNFLDLRTQLLLQEFLRRFRGGAVIVSHDRAFLKATCARTLELDRGKLTLFNGDVDVYLEHQETRREHDQRVNAATLAKRRQLEAFIIKNRANANTASQARSKAKQLERLKLIELDGPAAMVRIVLPDVEPRQGTALRCADLAIGYPNEEVASQIDVEVLHGTRTAVVGDNGQGKTTFLRSVTESLPPLAGRVQWGYGCRIGVYAQHVYTGLPEGDSIQEYLERAAASGTRPQAVLDMAGCFLFRGPDVKKQIRVLSGGERARLCLAGLLLGGYNVLVLDEPGNHLDVESVDALADALTAFHGTVLFTSHDRHFMRRVATHVIEVRDGSVVEYQGDYDHYLYRVGKEVADGARLRSKSAAPQRTKGTTKESRKEEARRRHQLSKEIRSLERQIDKHEQRKKEFEAQLAAAVDAAEVRRIRAALAAVEEKLKPIEQKWIQLQETLEKS